MIKRYYDSYIHNLKSAIEQVDFNTVDRIIKTLLDAHREDKQVFIVGNGGSAATASHFACDLAKWSTSHDDERVKRFRAVSLAENIARMTAISNDLNYEDIFVEQLKNYLNPGDILIALSASGSSPNILRAVQYAKSKGAKTIGLLGFGGGKAKETLDISLVVSSRSYGISEDIHLIMEHIIVEIIHRVLRGEKQKVVFLDRDGVVNLRPLEHRYVTSWEEFRFTPGIMETLRTLGRFGYKFVIITNQQGIGKGILPEAALNVIHSNMLQAFSSEGIRVEGVFYCPHTKEDDCFCRKPKAGLFYKAQSELTFNIDFENSYFVGDSPSDILAGDRLSLKTILVVNDSIVPDGVSPTHVVKDISEIVSILE